MSRIPLPSPESLTPEQRRVYDAIASGPRGGVRGPFKALLHVPELTDKVQALGEYLRYRTSLEPRLSELAILVTARHWDCQYEWLAHEPFALKGGLAKEVVEAIRVDRRPTFAKPDEAAIYDYAHELHTKHAVSADTYKRALDLFSAKGVVELTGLLGYYTMIAMTLNAHEIPLAEGTAPPLPPIRR
jgi:4-carboxymuconolactone decarboxylase